jgi:hypothetical protein
VQMFGTEHGTYLLTRHATEFMRARSAAFRSRFGSANSDIQSLRTYPNGAIQIEGIAAESELLTILRQEEVLGKELIAWTQFRSLPPFPKGLYQLIYTGEYYERAGQRGFVVVPTAYGPTSGGEDNLIDLCVSVGFRRRQNKESMRLFAEVVRSWSESASASGLFEEGPAFLAVPDMQFQGLRAQFRLDVSRSGQSTLNWLVLLVLDYGMEVNPVTSLVYGNEGTLDQILGAASGKILTLSTPGSCRIDSQRTPARAKLSWGPHVPSGATPDIRYRSERFPVLSAGEPSWEDFRLAVYFSRLPSPEERHEFSGLLSSWLKIGVFGGLGGRGIHSHGEVSFDDSTESASVCADMVGADPDVAIPILLRVLEGFDDGGALHIEAVVFDAPALSTRQA